MLGKILSSEAPQLRNTATSQHHLLATTINATDVIIDYEMVYALRNAMDERIGDEGIAFLFLLWACCHDIAWRCSDGWGRADYLRR